MNKVRKLLSGWGNYPSSTANITRPERYNQITIADHSVIARGLGRSYGDAALNSNYHVTLMERMNRFLSFDSKTGTLKTEAGASLYEILNTFVPRGWFLPVTPGTKYVTLGGCIATDSHGKNHHRDGTIGNFIRSLELLLPDGSKRQCSPTQDPQLFWATIGGMGLTGIITEATLQLVPIKNAYMSVNQHAAIDLDDTLATLDGKANDDHYSVAWIDCLSKGDNLGRSIVMLAHHATPDELPSHLLTPYDFKPRMKFSVPFNMPSWFISPLTVKAFNSGYYNTQKRKTDPYITDYDRYFYPLDAIDNWNRLYGKKGFIQYQFVVPYKTSREALFTILSEFSQSKRGSSLAVLKRFGKEGKGLLSFPKDGYTLALDIPISSPSLFPFLDKLDELVLKFEGRTYLAKDARMKPEIFRAMYPRFAEWHAIKTQIDPQQRISSDLSRRLKMESPP